MSRYIDANKLMKDGWSLKRTKYGLTSNTYEVMSLDCVPTADVKENVRGEWQKVDEQPYFRKHFHNEDSLVKICHEITRKVKGALWT